jgi:hypothetical protein
MSTLLAIESHFLTTANAIEGLKLRELRRLNTADLNATKKKFETSLQLSQIVADGFEWFKSANGKQTMANEGITWNAEDFAQKVYGYQKSFFYKLVKAGTVQTEKIEEYKAFEPENRTIEGLLKFIKDGGNNANEGGKEGEAGEAETRPEIVMSFKYKKDGKNLSLNMDSNGVLTFKGDDNESIAYALESLYRLACAQVSNQLN